MSTPMGTKAISITRSMWFWARINRRPGQKISELRKLQNKMFKSILKHAYDYTEFYHRLYRKQGITPDDIRSLDDIDRLPIISKQDLRKCSVKKRFSRRYDIKSCYEYRTSGSTGEPFKVYYEPIANSYIKSLHLRRLLIYDYKPWNTIVMIGPFRAHDLPSIKDRAVRKGLLNMTNFDENRLSLLDSLDANIFYLRLIKPEVIWCPPSYLRLLAEAIQKRGIDDVKPRIIISGAELLDPDTRRRVESIFKVKVFDEYGTVDVASRAIAWQCERHEGHHINMDAVYLEFIKDNEPVSQGEGGHIVATNLFRYATPMIRYDIGDIGIPSGEQCACGRSFPLIKSVEGRLDDYLILPDGRLLSPLSVNYVFWDFFEGIHRYQVVQEKINEIAIYVEPMPGFDNIVGNIRSRCSRLFGPEVDIEIIRGPIEMIRGRKHRVVTSKVKR